jgi:hypothetical protein
MKDNVPIANLRHLIRTLDRATRRWGSQRDPMGIWITEYGYQTKPPDPIAGVAPSRQGPLTAWGEYMAYRNRRVASVAQFLYVDDRPIPGHSSLSPQAWITWQSGLFTINGNAKPFALDYLRPIHVAQRGRLVRVFGAYRPGRTGASIPARIEFSRGNGQWRVLRNFTVNNPRGYLNAFVRPPGRGFVRIMWSDPSSGRPSPSRPARVR